jgi:hypothetical protein
MSRTEIDGGQVQDESLTGDDVLDGSLKHEDLESYSLATLDDVSLTTLSDDDLVLFNLAANKFINEKIYNIKLLYKRTFTDSEDINIPSDKVLQMHSPKIDGELYIDGEAYIL